MRSDLMLIAVFIAAISSISCNPTVTRVVSGSYVHALPPQHAEFEEFGCAILLVDIENLSATMTMIGHEAITLELAPIDESEWEESCQAFVGSRILEAFAVVSPTVIVVGDFTLESPRLFAGCHLHSVGLSGVLVDSVSGEEIAVEIIFQDPASAEEFC